ncbi:SSI family serine proteinase inhibitor [Streptomyces tropicalis]|uniref:SSI family serine proteinase inhibitor n=1 Tax=Streptomyces tropicalis TaxID=3034234 RepID=A0ABT6A6G8_9ACTN|nr:SSI family serine proteinase inhibitor [Streptomyces tropicalis]MDF3300236.1 SSI family serine proteinase inhibitor [Streptomyces tropicalis]
MPRKALRSAVLALAAAATTALLSAPVHASGRPAAEPSPAPYAPSAVVLAVNRAASAPARAVTLTCAYAPGGTHPQPAAACDALQQAQGRLAALTPVSGPRCSFLLRPVTVTLQGVWRGVHVDEERTFANECVMRSYGPLLAF